MDGHQQPGLPGSRHRRLVAGVEVVGGDMVADARGCRLKAVEDVDIGTGRR